MTITDKLPHELVPGDIVVVQEDDTVLEFWEFIELRDGHLMMRNSTDDAVAHPPAEIDEWFGVAVFDPDYLRWYRSEKSRRLSVIDEKMFVSMKEFLFNRANRSMEQQFALAVLEGDHVSSLALLDYLAEQGRLDQLVAQGMAQYRNLVDRSLDMARQVYLGDNRHASVQKFTKAVEALGEPLASRPSWFGGCSG